MELVSGETGQSLQLIHMDEVRPVRGGVFIPDLVKLIMERYRFQSLTERKEANQPLKFELGVMEFASLTIPIASLEIYTDGIIVNTRNTDDSDAIIDDFIPWIKTIAKLREPKIWLPRRYQSRLIVDLDRSSGDMFIANFTAISAILTNAFGADSYVLEPQITFGPIPLGDLPMSRTWSLQPRMGQPYIPNRYFSFAPLPTQAHFQMLQELEAVAIRRRK